MASRKSLLIVDPDTRSLRVLEVSLRKAGFSVSIASTSEEAWRSAQANPPDLLIADTQLPDESGFALCERCRKDERTREIAIIFLSSGSNAEMKMMAIDAGADDFLAKPVLVKEIVSRARAILERQESESLSGQRRDGHLRGTLSQMGVVDILQVMEAGAKSGVVHLASDPVRSGGFVVRGEARAALYFREGQMVDGQLGALSGAEALFRTLQWDDGDFEIEFADIHRPDLVNSSTQMLLLDGMRRVDEWSRLVDRLPRLDTRLTVDYPSLGRRFQEVPSEVRSVVHLFDGQRTLFEVVDAAPVDDATAVGIILRLLDADVLRWEEVGESADRPVSSIEAWLSADPEDERAIPTALEEAVIPSPHSPSEIMAAADPRVEVEDAADTTVPARRGTSIVLSRRTVPANREAGAKGGPVAELEREPSAAAQLPRLSIQRVSSIIQAASPLPSDHAGDVEVMPRERSAVRASSRPMSVVGRDPYASTAGELSALSAREVPAPPPVIDEEPPYFRHEAGEITDGAIPSDEPGLVIARRSEAEANGRAVGPVPSSTIPRAAPEPYGGSEGPHALRSESEGRAYPPLQAAGAIPGRGGQRPAGAEEDFFSAPGPNQPDAAVDWGEPQPRSLVERMAPIAVILVVLLFIAVTFGPRLMMSEEEEITPDELARELAQGAALKPPEATATVAAALAPEEENPPKKEPAPTIEKPKATVRAPATDRLPVKAAETPRSGAAEAALRDAEDALRSLDLEAAKSRFQGVIRLDRRSAAAHSGLAYTYLAEDNVKAARAEAFRALRLDKGNARANLVLGTIAQDEGKMEDACRRYRRYLRLGAGPLESQIRSVVGQKCSG